MRQRALFVILIATAVGCNQQTVDKKAESEKLMQVSREWSKASAARDVEKILSYWADDAVLVSGGQPTISGKQGIRQMVEGSLKDTAFSISWEPKSAEISQSGDLGYLIEDTKMTATDSTGKKITRFFKAVTIWKKQSDGSWKDVVDVLSPLP